MKTMTEIEIKKAGSILFKQKKGIICNKKLIS